MEPADAEGLRTSSQVLLTVAAVQLHEVHLVQGDGCNGV